MAEKNGNKHSLKKPSGKIESVDAKKLAETAKPKEKIKDKQSSHKTKPEKKFFMGWDGGNVIK